MKTLAVFTMMVAALYVVQRQNYNPHQYSGNTMGECIARTMIMADRGIATPGAFATAAQKVTVPEIVTVGKWQTEAMLAASLNVTNQ